MFDLEREIEGWVGAVAACGQAEKTDELEDHLRSEIEALTDSGLSEEEAFHQARQRMGDSQLLAREYAKNVSVLGLLCQAERKLASSTLKSGRLAALVIIQSLAWATVMIATAIVAGSDYDLLSPILLAGWFLSTMLPLTLLDLRSNARSEWACIRRWLSARRAA